MNAPSPLLPSDGAFVHAIECVAHGARVALPADVVERIVEYEVSPLPLAGPWIAGFAAHDAFVIVSIRLSSGAARGPSSRRSAKAALLTVRSDAAHQRTRWAVEVDEILSLVHVRPNALDPRVEPEGEFPPWLASATTAEGRLVKCLDVDSMLRSFGVQA